MSGSPQQLVPFLTVSLFDYREKKRYPYSKLSNLEDLGVVSSFFFGEKNPWVPVLETGFRFYVPCTRKNPSISPKGHLG